MKRFSFFLPLMLWVVWGAGLAQLTRRATQTITAYRAPALGPQAATTLSSAPRSERVVLVVLSGVSAHSLNDPSNPFAFRMLRRLAAEGAWGISNAVVPAGDAATWTALVSGAPPTLSGVVQDRTNSLTIDTLTAAPAQAIIIGSAAALAERQGLLGTAQLQSAPSSDRVSSLAAYVLRDQLTPLNVVLLDHARRSQYRGSALWERLDQQLAEIVAALDPARDTLLITADHGLLPDQRFGGTEARVTQTPLVLWGAQVLSSGLGSVQQENIAPSISLLLGEPLPRSSTGRPLVEALNLTPAERATALLAAAEQRWNLLQATASPPPAALETARTALRERDWQRTISVLTTGWDQLQSVPASASLGSEYVWGVGVPLVLLVLARLLAWRGQALARWLAIPFLGVEVYLLAWFVIFFGLAGQSVSWSTLHRDPSGTLLRTSLWSGFSLIIAVLPIAMLAVGNGTRYAVQQCLRLIVLIQLLGAAVCVTLWATISMPLAHTSAWAALLLVLTQLATTALVAPVAALVGAALTDIFERGR